MTAKYRVTNESGLGRAYYADNGHRVHFAPGESKELSSKPPEDEGAWTIEQLEEPKPEDVENKQQEVN